MKPNISPEEAKNIFWDVLVIGGGPAGSLSALLLAKQKLKVLLIDKDSHPRFKVCGGCLNPQTLEILHNLDILSGVRDKFVPLKQTQIFSAHQQFVIPLRGGVSVDRADFDAYLLECAAKEGASILLGSKVLSRVTLEKSVDLSIRTTEGTTTLISGSLAIGAFGIKGLKTDFVSSEDSYIGAGIQFFSNLPISSVTMAVGAEGYVGAVALSNGKVDVATAVSPELVRKCHGIGPAVDYILTESGANFHIPKSCHDWRGTPLLSVSSMIASERYFAVGDACGYVEPFTGEGISWALQSAQLAAPIIGNAARNWHPKFASQWIKTYKTNIGKHQRMCRLTKKILRFPPFIRNSLLKAAQWKPALWATSKIVGGAKLSWV